MLSDRTIRKYMEADSLRIYSAVAPFHGDLADSQFQPASVDLRLGPNITLFGRGSNLPITLNSPYALSPEECVLAATVETVWLPDFLFARVEGKSTWGRQFVSIHSTAGFIDPGFKGQITLEIKNHSPRTVLLPIGVAICQVSFGHMDTNVLRPYGSEGLNSKYQNQKGATEAKT